MEIEKKYSKKFAHSKKVPTFVVPKGKWGISSVGRAFEWHSKGQEFDSPMLHKKPPSAIAGGGFLLFNIPRRNP